MRKRCRLKICWWALALSQIALSFGSFAPQARPEAKRKVIVEARPIYPPLARKTNLSRVVRLRVTLSPASYPVSTEQLGGQSSTGEGRSGSGFQGYVAADFGGDQRDRPNQI